MNLAYNKACEIEDFTHPDLQPVLRSMYEADGPEHHASSRLDSKRWECSMAVRTFRDFGLLTRDATILGVGAGTEVTSYYLTQHVGRVIATDVYLRPGPWQDVAPPLMLARPDLFAPYDVELERLAVEHMDGRMLRFPNDSFDGIYSSGSIEHFGDLEYVANAAFEMGRVLRPGGILSLATELKLAGPPGEIGWEAGTILFTSEHLRRYIVDASGLEPVDDLRTDVSSQTLQCERRLDSFLAQADSPLERERDAAYPNLVLFHRGFLFGSVHLALRKTEGYPVSGNTWARPSATTAIAVRRADEAIGRVTPPSPPHEVERPSTKTATANERLGDAIRLLEIFANGVAQSRVARRLPPPAAGAYRTLLRIRYQGRVWRAQLDALRCVATLASAAHRVDEEQQAERASLGRLRQHLDELDHVVRDHTEHLRHIARSTREGTGHTGPPAVITGSDLVAAVKQVEDAAPGLGAATSVELTIAPPATDAAVEEAARHFGARLSPPERRARTEDAWFHVDLTGDSFDAAMQNAKGKLRQHGFLVLIGEPHSSPIDGQGFDLISTATVSIAGRPTPARVFVQEERAAA